MQAKRIFSPLVGLLLVLTLTAQPLSAADEPEEPEALEELEASDATEQAADTGPADEAQAEQDSEEAAQLRAEIERREAERVAVRQQNCEQARAEQERLLNQPPRRLSRVNESGEIERLTDEERQAHLDMLRTAEVANCD